MADAKCYVRGGGVSKDGHMGDYAMRYLGQQDHLIDYLYRVCETDIRRT